MAFFINSDMPAKRHHYVPEAYLAHFCGPDGKLWVYRKDERGKAFLTSPTNVALERFYYAFTRDDGSRDSDSLEQVFSTLESRWPIAIAELEGCRSTPEIVQTVLEFAALQRARVPAVRDAYELMRADAADHIARVLDQHGRLPPKPDGCADILDAFEISVDPESSLKAISIVLSGVQDRIFPMLGFDIVLNASPVPFITSDNPVAWFIPFLSEDAVKPYDMRPGAPLEFQFPLTPRLLLLGRSQRANQFDGHRFCFLSFTNPQIAKRTNRTTAKFSYAAVFSSAKNCDSLVAKYCDVSPVMHTTAFPRPDGRLVMAHMEFTKRRKKVEWK